MRATPEKPLIEAAELAARLEAAELVVLDCRHDLARPEWGAQAFAQAHIPGAQFAHLDRDLAAPVTRTSGRHPLPALDGFARTASRWGVDARTFVVAYDQDTGAYAARAWWLFRWAGHARVAVLNGGFAAWMAAGLPVTSAVSQRTPREFVPGPSLAQSLTTAEVQAALAAGSIRLVDARAAERFAGRNETIDPVAGHVPGAVNHPFAENLDEHRQFLPSHVLRERWRVTAGSAPPEQLVAMCGSGVTACHDLLALEVAGMRGAKLYAGSWSEWIRDPARPVATGAGSS